MHLSSRPRNLGVFLSLSGLITLAESSSQFSSLLSSLSTLTVSTTSSKITYNRDALMIGSSFFDHFTFATSNAYMSAFGSPDPTHGFVDYVDEATARNSELIGTSPSGNPRWGVDTNRSYTPGHDRGRPSVRIESKSTWTRGLFVFDVAHMPAPACGIWPALWTLGSGAWPAGGEIDVLENIHLATANQMVVHTGANCTLTTPRRSALATIEGNCEGSEGCRVRASTAGSYGHDFNSNGGGVYAMQWTSADIRIWFFPRDHVEDGALWALDDSGALDLSRLGLPEATFAGGSGCDVDESFFEHRLIFDTTFCGDWAGNAWPSKCPTAEGKSKQELCEAYVGANPEAFEDAYWEINAIAVFKESEVVGTPV